MTANALIIDDGKLWAFLRSALQQGRDIQATYVGGSESYEHCSARVDVAAQELVTKFIAKFGAAHEPSVWPPAEEYERARRARAAPPPPAPVTTFDGERIAGVLCKNCCKPFLQHIVLDEYGRKNVCPPASAPPPSPEHPHDHVSALVRIDVLVLEIEAICERFGLDPIQWLGDGWEDRS
jgi:hypothetical protein